MSRGTDSQSKFDNAMTAHRQGRLAEAEKLYTDLLRQHPNHFDSLHLLGVLKVQSGHAERGVELISKAVKLNPRSAAAHVNLAKALSEVGRPRAALKSLDAAVALNPGLVEAHNNRAIALGELGRLEEALASYDLAIGLKGDYAEALVNRGHVLTQLGRPEEALASLDAALALKPDVAEAHNNRGNALRALGRAAEALASFEAAIALRPSYPEALANRGGALADLGRGDEALESFDAALVLRPDNAATHKSRAQALLTRGEYQGALESFDRLAELTPEAADVHSTRGAVLILLGRHDDALASLDKALGLDPHDAEAHNARGVALRALHRPAEALASYDRAIELRPEHSEAYANRGTALSDLDRYPESLASFDRAIALRPDYPEAHGNRSIPLRALHRLDDALASVETAIGLRPGDASGYNSRGIVLNDLGRAEVALKAYDEAVALAPDYAEPHYNKALTSLLLGRFEEGWRLYEWRKKKQEPLAALTFGAPLWLGDFDVAGQRLFLWGEQGLGDTIQFCRYAKLAELRGARVTLAAPPALKALLGQLSPTIEVVDEAMAPPPFDCHAPLMSLPLAFGTTLETIPAEPAYLRADENLVAEWEARLGPKTKPRIGLVWSGNPRHRNDHNRSLSLADLMPHLPPEAQWVALQKDVRGGEEALLANARTVAWFGDQLRDFSDTAALTQLMDLVISVDTSMAHLAGAMGKPVWILLPRLPDFRWMLERGDSPWYPSARLFRQPSTGAWRPVIDAVKSALAPILGEAVAKRQPRRPTAKREGEVLTPQASAGPMLRTWGAQSGGLQTQAAVSVVIPTVLRPTLARAVKSVFAQAFQGPIQILVGIDSPQGSLELLEGVCASIPSHCTVQALYPGYSTSVRHGGPWAARDGGALRTVLSYLANAPLIAYLDDDNWWGPDHLASMARAIEPVDWAFSLRWFVHPTSDRPVCIDQWESVGPDAGMYRERFGGFVDPNCLMIKRQACAEVIPWWTTPLSGDPSGMSADRHVFDFLNRTRRGAGTGEATAYYVMNSTDGLHPLRISLIGEAYDAAGSETSDLPAAAS
jgi:tetratricopeptide (TPR) repeat protein